MGELRREKDSTRRDEGHEEDTGAPLGNVNDVMNSCRFEGLLERLALLG
ncbi:hypothetical protein FRIGORI9N_530017 [Frigoribacterium sp. 9N]|nr:hypothetical protein FRIGORI9N_530017 [Frigoribacterium sp. 9N]